MSEDFGSDFITIVDDDGTEFELEVLDTMDYNGETYKAFLPADMDDGCSCSRLNGSLNAS